MIPVSLTGNYFTIGGFDHAQMGALPRPLRVRQVYVTAQTSSQFFTGPPLFFFNCDHPQWGLWGGALPHWTEVTFGQPWVVMEHLHMPGLGRAEVHSKILDDYHDGIILPPCSDLRAGIRNFPSLAYVSITVHGDWLTHSMMVNPAQYCHDPIQ